MNNLKTLYLTLNTDKLTKVVFEKPQEIKGIKINKVTSGLNYFNITEQAHVKTASDRRDFEPGSWTFTEIAKKFKELDIE